jgi:hypothetical protein
MVVELFDQTGVASQQLLDALREISRAIFEPCFEKLVHCGTNEAQQQENKNHANSDIEKFGTKHGWATS